MNKILKVALVVVLCCGFSSTSAIFGQGLILDDAPNAGSTIVNQTPYNSQDLGEANIKALTQVSRIMNSKVMWAKTPQQLQPLLRDCQRYLKTVQVKGVETSRSIATFQKQIEATKFAVAQNSNATFSPWEAGQNIFKAYHAMMNAIESEYGMSPRFFL